MLHVLVGVLDVGLDDVVVLAVEVVVAVVAVVEEGDVDVDKVLFRAGKAETAFGFKLMQKFLKLGDSINEAGISY